VSRKKRVGLFGGTFNPVHLGHLRVAEQIQARFGLDEVLFIPSSIPPHKEAGDIAPARDRMAMVQLAIAGHAGFVASPIEVRARRKSYSIITLTKIKKIYPEALIFFILGADAFLDIETWKSYREVLTQCRFIIVRRPGYRLSEAKKVVPEEFRERMVFLRRGQPVEPAIIRRRWFILVDIPSLPVSSTEIRRRIRAGQSIRGLVPPAVEEYIGERGLYRIQRSDGQTKNSQVD